MELFDKLWKGFSEEVLYDPILTTGSSCLYYTLLYQYKINGRENGVFIFRRHIEETAKMSRTTFQKHIKDLQKRGYINYNPSYNPFLGNLVKFYGYGEVVLNIKIRKNEILLTTRQREGNL